MFNVLFRRGRRSVIGEGGSVGEGGEVNVGKVKG
jgi:hypothetical protein